MGISLARRHDSFREPVVQPCLPTPENLMFYEAQANKHGLKHDPFKALVVPRPIGWISTVGCDGVLNLAPRSEEHTSELQSLMRISYAVFCLKKKIIQQL